MNFEQIIKKYIAGHRLLKDDGMYIVALSGGPDSVALLRVLLSLGYNVHAAHCNFHLRGAESDRDENFCKALCQKLNVRLHIIHFDTNTYAELHKVSIEMAARDLRYHWFAQLSHDINADGVCIAHHQDDQVETVLLNIIRGTGLRGLIGMKPKNSIFLRPLLCVSESQVMDYLESLNQNYVIDSTNLENDARRNKLRLDIIPMLEKVNPAVKANIIRMTENLADVETIVNDSLEKAKKEVTVPDTDLHLESVTSVVYASTLSKPLIYSIPAFLSYPAPQTLYWAILSPHGFNRTQVKEIMNCKVDNKEWKSSNSIAIVSHDNLYIINRKQWEQEIPVLKIPEQGLYRYGKQHIRIEKKDINNSFTVPKESYIVAIDSSKIDFPLILRPIKAGDRFTPFGMKGSKLVSDYLKDRHRNIIERHYQLVLTDNKGQIIWLVGETIDNSCRIKAGITRQTFTIIFKPEEDKYGEGLYQSGAIGSSTRETGEGHCDTY